MVSRLIRHRCRDFCTSRASLLKKTLLASEAGRAEIVRDRRIWRTHRQPRMRQEPHRLVFIDETGTTTKMTRLRGRAREAPGSARLIPSGQQPGEPAIAEEVKRHMPRIR